MRRLLAVVVVVLIPATLPAADPPAAEKLPVAVVHLQRVIFESTPGKQVIQELEAYVAKKKKELVAKDDDANKLRDELAKNDKLTAEQKDALEKKLRAAETERKLLLTDAQRNIQQQQTNAVEQLQKEAERLIKDYAKERGIQVVIDTSGGEQGPAVKVILINPTADITEEMLKRMEKFKVQPIAAAKPGPKPQVVLDTTLGEIVLELDQERAPITVANFLKYVEAKHYDGTVFHRVIKNFMIQGGGFSEGLEEKVTRAPIRNEASNGLSNVRGTIAMARTSEPDSATAQFYINVVDNEKLDGSELKAGYTVFGKVTKGMDVVDKIRAVKTGKKEAKTNDGKQVLDDVPEETVVIKTARRVDKAGEKKNE